MDLDLLAIWWRETFLDLSITERAANDFVGSRGKVRSKGFLPYRFSWDAEVTTFEDGLCVISAVGDFTGTATFRRALPDEPGAFYFDWDVLIEEPLLKRLCPMILPLCQWNHAFALAVGCHRIEREIHRRRAARA